MLQITLPSGKVANLKEEITYGEAIKIDRALYLSAKVNIDAKRVGDPVTTFSPEVSFNWTRQKLLAVVVNIIEVDGKVVPIDDVTIEALSKADGKALEAEVEKILSEEKKS